jgi:hypothetical protein
VACVATKEINLTHFLFFLCVIDRKRAAMAIESTSLPSRNNPPRMGRRRNKAKHFVGPTRLGADESWARMARYSSDQIVESRISTKTMLLLLAHLISHNKTTRARKTITIPMVLLLLRQHLVNPNKVPPRANQKQNPNPITGLINGEIESKRHRARLEFSRRLKLLATCHRC